MTKEELKQYRSMQGKREVQDELLESLKEKYGV